MQLYYVTLEQLDLAAEQLHRDGPNYARFALIVTDNAIELMLHAEAEHLVMLDESGMRLRPPSFSATEREQAVGMKFPPKVHFCSRAGKLDADERDFILIAHRYRNELYHIGLKHIDIMPSLSWHYHDLACRMFPRFSAQNIYWSSQDRLSETVKRYTGGDGLRPGDCERHLAELAHALSNAKPRTVEPLPKVLAASAGRLVEEFDARLTFLVEDDPHGRPEPEVLRYVQAWHTLRGERPRHGESHQEFLQRIVAAEQSYRAPVMHNPSSGWLIKADDIQALESDIAALRAYEELRKEMRGLSEAVAEAALELDLWIQHQIDVARGK